MWCRVPWFICSANLSGFVSERSGQGVVPTLGYVNISGKCRDKGLTLRFRAQPCTVYLPVSPLLDFRSRIGGLRSTHIRGTLSSIVIRLLVARVRGEGEPIMWNVKSEDLKARTRRALTRRAFDPTQRFWALGAQNSGTRNTLALCFSGICRKSWGSPYSGNQKTRLFCQWHLSLLITMAKYAEVGASQLESGEDRGQPR